MGGTVFKNQLKIIRIVISIIPRLLCQIRLIYFESLLHPASENIFLAGATSADGDNQLVARQTN
jgi:hypothetical protein